MSRCLGTSCLSLSFLWCHTVIYIVSRQVGILSSCMCLLADKRPENSLAEDHVYGQRQTGHVVYSRGHPGAARSMASLPVVFLVTMCRHSRQLGDVLVA